MAKSDAVDVNRGWGRVWEKQTNFVDILCAWSLTGQMMVSLCARLGGGRPGRPGRPHDEAKASEVKAGAAEGDAKDAGNGGGGGGVELVLDSGREKAMTASQVGGIIVQATYQASLKNRSLKLS